MITFGNMAYVIYIALVAFLVLVVYGLYLFWKRRAMGILTGRGRAAAGFVRGSKVISRIKTGIIITSVLLCVILLLRPQWGEKIREVNSEGSDVLIALDVSRSMTARDVKPSRLDRAKDAVKWIVGSLKGDRVGLIVFAGDAFLQCPLTNDTGAFMMFLDAAGPESIRLQGTDMGRMFREAYRVFQKKRLTSKILVVITDGEDNEGAVIPAMKAFKELGVSVYTVGVGRAEGEYIPGESSEGSGEVYLRDTEGKLIRSSKNADLLKQLAGATGGAYLDITGGFSDLRFILEIIEDQQRNAYGSRIIKERKERFAIVAALLLALLSVELMLPERKISGRSKGRMKERLRRILMKMKRKP
ncbi:MAG: hypothetical protein CVV44_06160 [Spirochaetae bacterium HGW-Spirochaetae-1]|jgi:Ca-activated chloride channel family protein|nr:MAG: hypothetical protein CVV44_06160 [Spirochaetae bacterium HGW-Spirochaetae-1]